MHYNKRVSFNTDCVALSSPTDGTVACTAGNTDSSVCTFSCTSTGYFLNGPPSLTCTAGLWSGEEPLCEPDGKYTLRIFLGVFYKRYSRRTETLLKTAKSTKHSINQTKL